MRTYMIAASIAALAIGSAAQAEPVCRQDSTGRTVATVAGAGIGAVIGRVIDGGRSSAVGTIIGAGGGALLGREVQRQAKCR